MILRATGMLTVILSVASPALALTHMWSYGYGGGGTQHIASVASDGSGNVLAAGHYYSTTNFGGGDRSSAGGSDITVVKLNAAGGHVWDKQFGDANDSQYATAVSTDLAGNVYLAGAFTGTVNFGGVALTSLGARDLFLAKFGPTGTHMWSKRFGDAADQQSAVMLVDYFDNIYWTGYFAGAVNFGGGALTSAGGNDAFLVKFDAAGTHLWSKRFGDGGDQRGVALGTDHWGNIDLVLDFTGVVNFGPGNLTSAGGFDIGVVQYSNLGVYIWGYRFGDAAEQRVAAIATEPFTGYVYFTGANSGTVNFGGGNIATAGGSDIYLAKFDCYGNHMWSDGWGDDGNQSGTALATDDLGFMFLAGVFEGVINLGGGPLVSAGQQDVLLAGFNASGTHALSRAYGDPSNNQQPTCVIEDAGYNVLMGGTFQGTIDFGGSALTGTASDGFVVKMQPGVTGTPSNLPDFSKQSITAHPNPFNPRTTLRLVILAQGRARLEIFTLRGERVATLLDRDLHPGLLTASWNGTDDRGRNVGSGIYFARLSTPAGTTSTKLVLLK